MTRKRMSVLICDICEEIVTDQPPLGLSIKKAFYNGTYGGGPLPSDTFICENCVVTGEMVHTLITVAMKEKN